MAEKEILAEHFEASRPHLQAVAYRMLGSRIEAEDAVQEAWLRVTAADAGAVENLRAWMTTIVARICLDILRARKSRREEPAGEGIEAIASDEDATRRAEIADSIGIAMLVVLEALAPGERVAFVLHDMFDLPFEEIAAVVGRSPAAARQMASRARRRVQGKPVSPAGDRVQQRKIVDAFLSAARENDFSALLSILDPDVMLRADAAAVAGSLARASAGAPLLAPEIHGAQIVAKTFAGRAQAAQPALIDGDVGLVYAPGGKPFVVFDFVIENGRVVEISLIADRTSIAALDLTIL
jgi:RNA polymerase sigma factor (sigma-70 family)